MLLVLILAFACNLRSSLSTLVGAPGAHWWRDVVSPVLPHVMALSAASFLYIALADLVPLVHHQSNRRSLRRHLPLMLAGVATIVLLHRGVS
jgi:zinc and cadmium transporter